MGVRAVHVVVEVTPADVKVVHAFGDYGGAGFESVAHLVCSYCKERGSDEADEKNVERANEWIQAGNEFEDLTLVFDGGALVLMIRRLEVE